MSIFKGGYADFSVISFLEVVPARVTPGFRVKFGVGQDEVESFGSAPGTCTGNGFRKSGLGWPSLRLSDAQVSFRLLTVYGSTGREMCVPCLGVCACFIGQG